LDFNLKNRWRPPVLKTIAIDNIGIQELLQEINNHIKYLNESGELEQRRQESAKKEIFDLIQEKWKEILSSSINNGFLNKIAARIVKREEDPYTAVKTLSNILIHSYTQGGMNK
jgi:LAO/AO transport system kinase